MDRADSSSVYGEILLPTDGSAGTETAAEHAIEHARQYDATLHVLHVVDTGIALEGDVRDVLGQLESAGESAVENVAEMARDRGLESVVTSVVHGTPHRSILEYADDNGIDLIVMGTHGRTGLDRYLLGSVAEKVVRLAECPVLTTRMPGKGNT